MFAAVSLVLDTHEDALVIPEQALVPQAGGNFVYRVKEGHAELVPVQLGIRRFGEVEITDGLAAGDVVVTSGQLKIFFPGAPVMPVGQGMEGGAPPQGGAPEGAAPEGAGTPEAGSEE
jgi:membrane fusion protein (multidrug efflux system)